MFGLSQFAEPGRIGCQKGKRVVITFILHQMEKHSAHKMQIGAVCCNEIRNGSVVRLDCE